MEKRPRTKNKTSKQLSDEKAFDALMCIFDDLSDVTKSVTVKKTKKPCAPGEQEVGMMISDTIGNVLKLTAMVSDEQKAMDIAKRAGGVAFDIMEDLWSIPLTDRDEQFEFVAEEAKELRDAYRRFTSFTDGEDEMSVEAVKDLADIVRRGQDESGRIFQQFGKFLKQQKQKHQSQKKKSAGGKGAK